MKKRQPNAGETIRRIYRKLTRAWGPQHWWPAESPFEVIVGAILTQNTSWTNVEKAIGNLRAADALSVACIRGIAIEKLEELIRPSGYFRQKATRLKSFVEFLDENYAGSLDSMLATPTLHLREQLLALKGIGPETADSILVYAGHHAVFVVDAYTRRVLERHNAIAAGTKYDEIRELVELALRDEQPGEPLDLSANCPEAHTPSAMSTASRSERAQVFNEMHGLFVQLGKHYCSNRDPKCDVCPLGDMLTHRVVVAPQANRSRRASRAVRSAARKSTRVRVP